MSRSISRPAVAEATTVRSLVPWRMIWRTTAMGWLSAPKPPTAMVMPSLICAAASWMDCTTSLRFLLTLALLFSDLQDRCGVDGGVLSEGEAPLVLGQRGLRPPRDLPRPGLAAQLPDQLGDLQQSGRAHRVPTRAEAAAGIDGDAAGERGDPLVDQAWPLPRTAEPEPLVEHQLRRRHRVVQLDHVEVVGADAGLLVGLLR